MVYNMLLISQVLCLPISGLSFVKEKVLSVGLLFLVTRKIFTELMKQLQNFSQRMNTCNAG
jgi:hypothetical protein